MTTMTHDGYLATLEIDEGANVIHGRVVNARAVLTFEGETLSELRTAFADTIADYRDWCKERGVEPEMPYSGTLSLRIAPELHRRVSERPLSPAKASTNSSPKGSKKSLDPGLSPPSN